MEAIVEVGAGLDVHKKTVVACCIDGRSRSPRVVKRTFGTFRHQLEQLRSWLVELGCTDVAMESTGVYWMPVYRVLENSVKIVLGNAGHMANVPGRKTDQSDAEWIAQLLRHGLIRPNFVPPAEIRHLRQLTRLRRKLIQMQTSSKLRVEKLLQSSNIKLSSVASEVFGVSGQQMLQAMAAGVTNPETLAELSRGRLRKKRVALTAALNGSFGADEARLLKIQLAIHQDLHHKIAELERLIGEHARPYAELIARLDTIPGINRTIAIAVLAEIGTDMRPWPSDRHFAAWSGTCPGNRESGGVRRQAKARPGNRYLKSILCQAAWAAVLSRASYHATRYRHLAARRGNQRAIVAIAHELAISVYHVVRTGKDYQAPAIADPAIASRRRAHRLIKELQLLGYQVSRSE